MLRDVPLTPDSNVSTVSILFAALEGIIPPAGKLRDHYQFVISFDAVSGFEEEIAAITSRK
jgi:hypothetical protein